MMFWVFGKLTIFAIKASWTILKVMVWLVFLPLTLIGLFIEGLVYIAIPVLAVIGLFSLLGIGTD
jgi:small-conductance mechanosensitive channel